MAKGLFSSMLMDFLKGLLKSNQNTETNNTAEAPLSEAPVENWQGYLPWGHPSSESGIDGTRQISKPESTKEKQITSEQRKGFFQRINRQRTTNASIPQMNRRPSGMLPGFHAPGGFQGQPGSPLMPPPQRGRSRMEMPYYAPQMKQRQVPGIGGWNVPVQGYPSLPPQSFGIRNRSRIMDYPPQFPVQNGYGYPGMPRRQVRRQIRGPWL